VGDDYVTQVLLIPFYTQSLQFDDVAQRPDAGDKRPDYLLLQLLLKDAANVMIAG